MKTLLLILTLTVTGCGYQLVRKPTLPTADMLQQLPVRQRGLALVFTELSSMAKVSFLMVLGGLLTAAVFKIKEALIVAAVGAIGLGMICALTAYGDVIGLVVLIVGGGLTGYLIWQHFKRLNDDVSKYKTGFGEVVKTIEPFVNDEFKKVARAVQSEITQEEVKKLVRR